MRIGRLRVLSLIAALGIILLSTNLALAYPTDATADRVYGRNGSFSENGTGTTSLNRPISVAVDSTGGLYVADTLNHRVLFFASGSITATRVYGQSGNFTTGEINKGGLSADSLHQPTGVEVDATGVYVTDRFNNRVLFYSGFVDTTADRVYGQPDFISDTANNGGISATSLNNPSEVVVDATGVYIADTLNSRVLFYSGFVDTTADRVYGQPDFATNSANGGLANPTTNTLNLPEGLAVDSDGLNSNDGVYIADGFNYRVLFYPTTEITATRVYGQNGDFTTRVENNGGISANSLNIPTGVSVAGTEVYIADHLNNRVLHYAGTSTTADRVYGQGGSFTTNFVNSGGLSDDSLYEPYQIALEGGGIYITDGSNNRVLHYAGTSTSADRVYGQAGSLLTRTPVGGVSATNLYAPTDVAVDSSGGIYICDSGNHRVLYFAQGATTATRVYGQDNNFGIGNPNEGGADATTLNEPRGVAVSSSGVYIADTENNRVLYFDGFSDTTADMVYGQANFTAILADRGGAVAANTLDRPHDIAVDSTGVYIADRNNHRVLFYSGFMDATADRVYGQGGVFTTATVNKGGISANSLNQPSGVAADSTGVYIADSGNHRALFYSGTADTTADRVYGQNGSFNSNVSNIGGSPTANGLNIPSGVSIDVNRIFISDSDNNRVLSYPGVSTTADQVYGQPEFDANAPNFGGAITANTLYTAGGIAGDGFGLYVTDINNNRVLYYTGKADTTSAVTSSPNPSTFGQTITITGTVSTFPNIYLPISGTVTLFDGVTNIGGGTLANLNNATGVYTITTATLTAGNHNLTAQYPGNTNFFANISPVYVHTVNKANTTTALISSAGTITVGNSIVFTATVAPVAPAIETPSGSVEFYAGATLLGTAPLNGSAVASFSTNIISTGAYSITARYLGNSNYNISTSSGVNLTVNKQNTTTSLASNPNPVNFGDNLVISATVSTNPPGGGLAPTGTVNFFDGVTLIGSANLTPINSSSSSASITVNNLSVGAHSLTAQFAGSGNFNPSNSGTLDQAVQLLGTVKLLPNTVRVASTQAVDGLNSPRLNATGTVPSANVSASTAEFSIGGANTIPLNAKGIFGVLTNIGCTGGGNLRFFVGNTVPNAANLNIPGALPSLNLSTNFIAALDNGKVKLGLGSGATISCGYVLDVSGYIVAPEATADRINLLTNTVRVASTQPGDGLNSPKLTAGGTVPSPAVGASTVEFSIGGNFGIPANAKGIVGVLVNVGCTGGGNFRFFTGNFVPNASNLNVPGALFNLNLSTGFIAALDNGKVKLGLGSGQPISCGYVLDVVGYITTPENGFNLNLLPNNVRVASTQPADALNSPKLTANAATPVNSGSGTTDFSLAGNFGIPLNAKGVFGVLVNVGCGGGGNFRFWTGALVPNASNLNVPGARPSLNLSTGFTAGLDAFGKVKLGLGSGQPITCGYITDVVGYLR
jgi:Bacterial Ig-like domain (group 3)/NHL repeat